jgi:hypothetical protein
MLQSKCEIVIFHTISSKFSPLLHSLSFMRSYTDLRCKRFPTCWYFWAAAVKTNGTGLNFCSGGGIFQHGKAPQFFGAFDGIFPNVTALQRDRPYESRYKHDCDII